MTLFILISYTRIILEKKVNLTFNENSKREGDDEAVDGILLR